MRAQGARAADFGNRGVSGENRRVTSTYAIAPQLRARIMGAALVLIGLLLTAATLLVALLDLSLDLLVVFVVLVLIAIFGLGHLLVRRWYVVRLDDLGYRVRFVRGAGVTQARWADVASVEATEVAGARCVMLSLRNGETTTIPVDVVEGGASRLVEDVRSRLVTGAGRSR